MSAVLEVAIPLPRPVTSLHQIELSSLCSLRCVYCPSPSIVAGKFPKRPAQHMTMDILSAALDHVHYFLRRGTQGEINLAGIGESMMREDFLECVETVRTAAPFTRILLATNGLHLTEAIAKELSRLDVKLWVSLHRPEKAGLAVAIANKFNILEGTSADPSVNSDDWAGQVSWPRSYVGALPCNWIRMGWVMVMAHGYVTTCCLDAQGIGVIGAVNDAPGSWKTQPYKLCAGCQQEINVRGFDQRKALP